MTDSRVANSPVFGSFTAADLAKLGLLGATLDRTLETLTFHFTNRTEVWTRAPDGYPIDGSMEVMRFEGAYYVPPPARGAVA